MQYSWKNILPLILAIAVIIIIAFAGYLYLYGPKPTGKNIPPTTQPQQKAVYIDSISVQDQKADTNIIISEVVLTKPGFVLIQKVNADGGFGAIIGNSLILSASTHRNVQFMLYKGSELKTGDQVVASLRYDDGDGTYGSADVDLVVKNQQGEVQQRFTIQ